MNTALDNEELARLHSRYLHDDRGRTNDPDTEGYGYDYFGMFRDLETAESALRYVRAEAAERAQIAIQGTNTKGALEVAVTGLWNIESAARKALQLEGPSEAESVAASSQHSREWRTGSQIVSLDGMTAADYAESHGAPRDAQVGVVVDAAGKLVDRPFLKPARNLEADRPQRRRR
jgi:hypothetical protein